MRNDSDLCKRWSAYTSLLAVLMLTSFTATAADNITAAETAVAQKDHRMAIVYYQRALQEDPERADLLSALALSYEASGQKERAIEAAEKSLALSKDDSRAFMIMGRYEFGQKHWGNAITYYQSALSADPNLTGAQVGIVQAYHEMGETQSAKAAQDKYESISSNALVDQDD